jgi:hypothetical protein
MKMLIKILAVPAILLAVVAVLAGRSFSDSCAYVKASAAYVVDALTRRLPSEVREKKLFEDLGRMRDQLVERRVKLSLCARQIDQLRAEVKTIAERADRTGRVLADAYPVLLAANRGNNATVRFASAEIPVADFHREVDDLLATRESDTKALAAKREALKRLEQRHAEADLALADEQRALDAAEREAEVLIGRRNNAVIVAETIENIGELTESSPAPRASIAESLGGLRDEVTEIEVTNDVRQANPPLGARPKAGALARQYNRLDDLKAVHDEMGFEPRKPKRAEAIEATINRAKNAGIAEPNGDGE